MIGPIAKLVLGLVAKEAYDWGRKTARRIVRHLRRRR
jgi:hypothetical protein